MKYATDSLRQIIRCALNLIEMWSQDAEELLLGTAAKESHLGGLGTMQIGGGPARGIYQIEPATEKDVWENYLRYKPEIAEAVTAATGVAGPDPERLRYDPVYGSIIARLIYRRIRAPLPKADDVQGLAEYWKDHYNTARGKGHPHEFVELYSQLVT